MNLIKGHSAIGRCACFFDRRRIVKVVKKN